MRAASACSSASAPTWATPRATRARGAATRSRRCRDTRLVARSSLYRSAPVDAAGADFVNAVAELRTGAGAARAAGRAAGASKRASAASGRTATRRARSTSTCCCTATRISCDAKLDAAASARCTSAPSCCCRWPRSRRRCSCPAADRSSPGWREPAISASHGSTLSGRTIATTYNRVTGPGTMRAPPTCAAPGDRMLFGKLLPREGNFFELFNQHAQCIVEAARAFMLLIQQLRRPDAARQACRRGRRRRARRRPHHAEVNRLLHKTFITPIDREQIHGLINAMDDIVDLLQDATETMSLYDVRQHDRRGAAPGRDQREVLRARAARGRRCCRSSAEAEVAEAALKTCEEIDQLESDADRVMRAAMSQAVPRGARRARADQAEGDLRAAGVDLRPLRGRGQPDRGRRPRELLTRGRATMEPSRSRSGSSRCWSCWRWRSTS